MIILCTWIALRSLGFIKSGSYFIRDRLMLILKQM